MLQDARTNKADKAATVVITIMSNRTTTTAPAVAAAVEPAVTAAPAPEVAPAPEGTTENAAPVSFFDQFSNEENSAEKTRDDIVAELMLKPNVRRLNGLHIRNVVTNPGKDVPFLTFVVKEWVIGDTRSGVADAFGIQQVVLGKTHNVIVGAYAVSAVMKDNPRTAIFAARIGGDEDIANMLFAGGTMDILMEYVAAGETYTNPFSSNGAETVFDRDHIIFHILSLTMGEAGRDAYAARLARI